MSVHKDKKRGTYFFSVRVEDSDGSQRQVKRRGFESAKEARLAEAEFMVDWENNNVAKGKTYTFEKVANEYLEWYEPRRKHSSFMKINSVVTIQLIPYFGSKKIDDITNRDIMNFQTHLIKKYSVAHAKRIHAVLSAVFNYAKKADYTMKNPASEVGNIDLPENKRIDYWTLEEFKQFLSVVENELHYAMFLTFYYSGMRKGELLALTWNDLDFENQTININKTNYYRQITEPKTLRSTRVITMPKFVMSKLQQVKSSTKYYKPDYVIFGEFYDSMPTTTLDFHFRNYIKKSGVKRIRIHDFRHSHASYLINRNAIPSVVAKRLGHSNPATTLNIYSHLYPSTEKEIVNLMEDDFKTADILNFKAK